MNYQFNRVTLTSGKEQVLKTIAGAAMFIPGSFTRFAIADDHVVMVRTDLIEKIEFQPWDSVED